MGSIDDSSKPTFHRALAVSAKIGVLSFGGRVGKIELMHRILVDERKWIAEDRFLDRRPRFPTADAGRASMLDPWAGDE
jgi:chromate transporter